MRLAAPVGSDHTLTSGCGTSTVVSNSSAEETDVIVYCVELKYVRVRTRSIVPNFNPKFGVNPFMHDCRDWIEVQILGMLQRDATICIPRYASPVY